MAITQRYLDNELALAKKIFIYYSDKLVYYTGIGSRQYERWYTDKLQLYCLVKYLENIIVDGESCYLGAEEITSDQVLEIFHKVREYYKSDVDTDYEIGEISITETPSYIRPFVADWKEFEITITESRPSTITLPVSVDIMDKESIQMVVNGISDPSYNDNPADIGYHIIDNILYWHSSNFYDLLPGDVIRIQYLQIVG